MDYMKLTTISKYIFKITIVINFIAIEKKSRGCSDRNIIFIQCIEKDAFEFFFFRLIKKNYEDSKKQNLNI